MFMCESPRQTGWPKKASFMRREREISQCTRGHSCQSLCKYSLEGTTTISISNTIGKGKSGKDYERFVGGRKVGPNQAYVEESH